MEISTQQKGKQAEFFVFGELMRRGFDLYLPVIDTGIDALIRLPDGMCQEIQVKSTQAKDQAGYFNVYDVEPHADSFIVCVDMSSEKLKKWNQPEVWILPAKEFVKYARVTKLKDSVRYMLPLPERDTKHGKKPREELLERFCANRNENAWEILRKGG